MTKRTVRLMGVTTTALIVSACVQQLWQTTYPGPNNYFSEPYDLTLDQSQNLVMIGRTRTAENDDTLFVAKYDSAGNLIWDYTKPGYLNFRNPHKSFIQTDSDNNVLVAGASLEADNIVTLLNEDGEVLWEKERLATDSSLPFLLDLAVTPSGMYLVSTISLGLQAFDVNGDLLWQYPEASDIEEPIIDLPDFNAINASLPFGEIAVSENQDIFFATSSAIIKLNNDGVLQTSISYSDLLPDGQIADIDINGGTLAISGRSNDETAIHFLDTDLNTIQSLSLNQSAAVGGGLFIDFQNDGQLCFAARDSYFGESTLIAGVANENSIAWQQETTGTFYIREIMGISASNNQCYITTMESIEEPFITTYTRIYNDQGDIDNTISLEDFISYKAVINGSNVYHAGITGEYDEVAGTAATISSHSVR